MSQDILKLEDISYSYSQGNMAIKNLNVSIQKGERIVVLGRNGAGKSTFFLLCNGILAPHHGKIYLDGKEVTRKKKDLTDLRRRVGIVFQEAENQLIAGTVEGEVSFGPMNLNLPLGEVESRTKESLKQLDLLGYEDRMPQYLSGGEKKRVTIADILAMKPDIIMLDEPTSSLDPENVARLETILNDLTKQGMALIVSTHDVDFAARFARRGLVFSQGELIYDNSLNNIFSNSELLSLSGLRKPLIMQAAEILYPKATVYPLTTEELIFWKNSQNLRA